MELMTQESYAEMKDFVFELQNHSLFYSLSVCIPPLNLDVNTVHRRS